MAFTPSQVQAAPGPRPIWGGQAGASILVYNPDAANTVYLGGTSGITVGAANTLPLGPGQSVALDGSDAIYACANPGTAATVVIPGGAAFFLGLTQAQGALALASMRSPNFVSGASGWEVTKSGHAEFNDITVRGGIVVDGTGLYYSGTPGLGTLTASVNATGPDQYGNATLPGVVAYQDVGGATPFQAIVVNGARLQFYGAPAAGGPWTWRGNMWMPGSGTALQVSFPEVTFQSTTSSDIIIGGALTIVAPSGDTTGATDTANINAALGGGNVQLLPGGYYVNAPLSIPSYTSLLGPVRATLGPGTPPGIPPVKIIAVAGFTGSQVVSFAAAVSATMAAVTLDCSAIGGSTVNGIGMSGACYDVHLEDVYISHAPHNGIATSGTHMRFDRVTCTNSGNFGANVTNATDSSYVNCLMFASNGANWSVNNCSNSAWLGSRAEWSATGSGFSVSGASGSIWFAGCSTDQNQGAGLNLNGVLSQATDGGGVIWTGGKIHADGHNGTSPGISIQGCTAPVAISGVNVEAGQFSGSTVPGTAIAISTSTAVAVGDSILQGQASAWSAVGGALARSGCIGATGNIGAQAYARLADI